MSHIEVVYLATRPKGSPDELAEAIAREQSLEILAELIPPQIARDYLGRVRSVAQVDTERWALTIAYPEHLASDQVGQLLHLLYGNVSFYPRIRLQQLRLPDTLLARFPGPLGGIDAVREHIDVVDRTLLLSVLKPRGSSAEHLADLAYRFARGGGDILKDDQNLVEKDLGEFRKRIRLCAEAVDRAAQDSGRRCLYLPHVAGSGAHLSAQLEAVRRQGLAGVVLCPWVMGLEHAATAAREHGLMWLAHPAMAGAFTQTTATGIVPELIFGSLPRLAGADLVIYPGDGGRISTGSLDTASAIHDALLGQQGPHHRSLPCSGGGKTLDQLPALAARHGPDCAVVVGGDLLR
ncbi:MAG: hypothetical protein EA370_09895, partial [Wenzhouxiangella sp.]